MQVLSSPSGELKNSVSFDEVEDLLNELKKSDKSSANELQSIWNKVNELSNRQFRSGSCLDALKQLNDDAEKIHKRTSWSNTVRYAQPIYTKLAFVNISKGYYDKAEEVLKMADLEFSLSLRD